MPMTESNRLTLRPLLIRPFGDQYFRVMRWGGNSKVVTRQLGVETLRRLKQGQTIGEVQAHLAALHGKSAEEINLRPLLDSLAAADLIAKVDDTGIPVRKPVTTATLAKFVWAVYGLPAVRAIVNNLRPVGVARLALEALERAQLRKPFRPAVDQARRNIDLILGEDSSAERARLLRKYYQHLILNIVDMDMLEGCNPAGVRKWIGRNVRVQRLQEFQRAHQAKRGVILAVFHFGSPRLLPVILSLRGHGTISIGPPNLGVGLRRTQAMLRAYDSIPGNGAIEILPGFELERIRTLTSRLREGATAMCMADAFAPSSLVEESERSKFFGSSSAGFSNGTTCVEVKHRSIHLTSWIGWLASVSGALVVPVVMLRRPDHGLDVIFENVLTPDGRGKDAEAAVNQSLYRVFGWYLEHFPEQWFPWRNVHQLALHDPASGTCDTVRPPFRHEAAREVHQF